MRDTWVATNLIHPPLETAPEKLPTLPNLLPFGHMNTLSAAGGFTAR